MSLDQNLFTLNITPSTEDPNVIDLVDPAGTIHYRRHRVPDSTTYIVNVYDPTTDSLLVTATAPLATSKHKTLQLHNPSVVVELKYTGTLTFKWGFKWEDHEFEWRREECYILRKPDPAVLVAVTKEPAGRLKTSTVQILDYNLNRFDIDDRKGLEIIILTALLTFQDVNDAYHAPRAEDAAMSTSVPPATSSTLTSLRTLGFGTGRPSQDAVPTLPPKPPPRVGIERIAEMHMLRTLQGEGEANELEVTEEGSVEEYAQFAQQLLSDEAMLFVTVRSASPAEVPKVLRVVEETKRLRYKSGLDDEELHQYVSYDADKKSKGPRRINLNDPRPKDKQSAYAPPSSLLVHLSKIDMPELQPKAEVKDPGPELGWITGGGPSSYVDNDPALLTDYEMGVLRERTKGKSNERNRAEEKVRKQMERDQKLAEAEQRKADKEYKNQNPFSHPEANRLTKPSVRNSKYHVPH
ncbi:uncharacterized protein LAESUDRAFT_724832 [Laetiporus sulphureus 93-53]|uniref:Uncharacterized protein n=1 Tax=Laetiporus sulphureus 93-53 TaxID=1314785 RepID=A0A165EMJ1_9APHY|nr:uncharacterized protein LAESUDRAFT_724832 [Laetiporus sulphureus 93-53]KZT07374.1 hypothetical protein LAESUDRAFT_724832 [Laetiporus sulphureus 93-53]